MIEESRRSFRARNRRPSTASSRPPSARSRPWPVARPKPPRQTASEQRAIAFTARDEARSALDLGDRYLYLLRVNQANAAWRRQ